MKPLWWMRGPLMEAAGDGTGGGGGDAFDPVKFRTEILAEFNKGLNGALKNLKTELTKPPEPKAGDPEPEPEPKPGDKTDPAVKALQKKIAEQEKAFQQMKAEADTAKEATRKEKRNTTLTTELGKLGVPAERMKSALRALDPDVKFSEDGTLVGDDDTALTDYLPNWIKANEHFLPAKPVGGAGASAGGGRRQEAVGLEDIKPGMKAEDLARARAEIANVLTGGR